MKKGKRKEDKDCGGGCDQHPGGCWLVIRRGAPCGGCVAGQVREARSAMNGGKREILHFVQDDRRRSDSGWGRDFHEIRSDYRQCVRNLIKSYLYTRGKLIGIELFATLDGRIDSRQVRFYSFGKFDRHNRVTLARTEGIICPAEMERISA